MARLSQFEWLSMFRRKHWLVWAPVSMMCAVLAAGVARAQTAPKADPSPLAPGDLKRPIFDTQTPVYEATHQQEKSANTVVGEVDGRAITLADVSDAIKEMPASVQSLPFADLFPGILGKLIRQQALVIKAQQQALDEDPAIRRKVKAAADQVLANEYLHHEIQPTISEQALLDRYNKEIVGKPGPVEVHVRLIMAPTQEAAAALITELNGGADFATVARRSSQDTTAPAGGDLGWVRLDGLNAEVGSVAFSLQPGQITPFPVRSAGAWFIVKSEDRRQLPASSFAQERGQLEQALLREGVGDVVTRALAGITVREYNISGKETSGGARD